MKLSILIPTLPTRTKMFEETMCRLGSHSGVEILSDNRGREVTTGKKRNDLIEKAQGEYFCFVDDDDWTPDFYVTEMLKAISHNPDCITFKGHMTEYGKRRDFIIRLGEAYEERNGMIYRWPNHLCAFKKALVQKFKFLDRTIGEDYLWSKEINDSKVLKTEYYIDKEMYVYLSVPNKKY